MNVAVVVIGRNEGARFLRCLASLQGRVEPVIYVDSGSTDGSVDAARAAGAEVIELDMSIPFTAARARNAGLERLTELRDRSEFVQVVDGDCELRNGWIEAGVKFLGENPDVAIVAGRLRERFPEATIWNRLADAEWDTPTGAVDAVGGIALLRRSAIAEVEGYREDLIAGEEPEMCLRLRRKGWRIWRLADEMAWHDIAMTRFGQWWRRQRRTGHTYAEGAALHGTRPERYLVRERRRALAWGLGIPLVAVAGAVLVSPWAFLLLLMWPAQILRLRLRGTPWLQALFLTLGKLAETQGVLGYRFGRQRNLIEYK